MNRIFVLSLLVLVINGGSAMAGETKNAIFAGGCFWCLESDIEKLSGVIEVKSGYTGDSKKSATYEQVSAHETNHREAVIVKYDPEKISYGELLVTFWRSIDPFDSKGQFCDKGFQYTAAIYHSNDEERKLAEQSKELLNSSGKLDDKIITDIEPAQEFYDAEDYHQDYYKSNPVRYKYYRYSCGRDKKTKSIWKNLTLKYNKNSGNGAFSVE